MIDRTERDRLALALRRLAAGRISNDQFDDAYADSLGRLSNDPALRELATFGWLHYSDNNWPYRLRGRHALSRQSRRNIARAVLFLKSDQEYIHGDVVYHATVPGRDGSRILVSILIAAIVSGIGTSILMGTFALGFAFVVLMALFLWNLVDLIGRVARRFQRPRSMPLSPGERFRPLLDEHAADEAFRHWPFASDASYRRALEHPPFLCGPAKRAAVA